MVLKPNDGSNITVLTNDSDKLTKNQLQQKLVELTSYSNAQEVTIQKCHSLLAQKDEKIVELEAILMKTSSLLDSDENTINVEVDEVTIAKNQLQRLGYYGLTRDLTSDEARRFEIFSKVIQQSQRLDSEKYKGLGKAIRDVTPKKLIEIAAMPLSTDKNVTDDHE